MKNTLTVLATLVALALQAQLPGDLDTSFGNGGQLITDAGATNDYLRAVAIQPDGKILLAGEFYKNSTNVEDVVLMRLLPDGSLDGSFGTGGIASFDVSNSFDGINAIALQPDGKIVVAGTSDDQFSYNFLLARFLPNGDLDGSFGTSGIVTKDFGSTDRAYAVAIQPDGKVVMAGWVYGGSTWDFAVVRYNADGSPDNSFSNDSYTITDIDGGQDYANAMALQSDGKIIVVGEAYVGSVSYFTVVRYNPDGSLDNSFSFDGKQTASTGSLYGVGRSVVLQPDGKIVVAGESNNALDADFGLLRFLADGTLDNSFGTGGVVTASLSALGDYGSAVARQPDGKILVAGKTNTPTNGFDFMLARFNADGSPDPVFGTDGIATADFNAGMDLAEAMALQPDGKVVLVGYSDKFSQSSFVVARFHLGAVSATNDVRPFASGLNIYPNPANSAPVFSYQLLENEQVTISLHDLHGRTLKMFADQEPQAKGLHQMVLPLPEGLPHGVFLIRVASQNRMVSMKLLR